jgi:hypothetical protein
MEEGIGRRIRPTYSLWLEARMAATLASLIGAAIACENFQLYIVVATAAVDANTHIEFTIESLQSIIPYSPVLIDFAITIEQAQVRVRLLTPAV